MVDRCTYKVFGIFLDMFFCLADVWLMQERPEQSSNSLFQLFLISLTNYWTELLNNKVNGIGNSVIFIVRNGKANAIILVHLLSAFRE